MALSKISIQRSVRITLHIVLIELMNIYFRLLKRFYDFQQKKNFQSEIFSSDETDHPQELELSYKETLPSCLFLTLTTLPLILNEHGRSIYCKLCLFVPPLTVLWMHLFSSSRKN